MPDLPYTDPATITEMASDTTAPAYGRTASGYGRKIPTRHRLRINSRWHRVYVMQYGNAGSAYVVLKGTETFLDTDTEHRLMEV